MTSVACLGLNDHTWIRERATQSIASFVSKSFSIYRGNIRHEICRELFGNKTQESQLTTEDRNLLIATLDARSKWQIKRHGDRNSIYSSECKKTLICKKTVKHAVCSACEDLKNLRSLIKALNMKYADDDNIKYGRDDYMSDNINAFSPTLLKMTDARLLATSVESASKGDFSDFLTVLAASSRNGLFDNHDAPRGLIKAVAVKAERQNADKTTRGMRIDSCLDEFVMTLGAISPRALNLFNDNFAGRSHRSLRIIRAKDGMQLLDDLHIDNFKRIAQVLKDLGYSGPVAAASDQTVCVKRLRYHNGFLVGAQGGDLPFEDPSELPNMVKSVVKNKELCSKVSLFIMPACSSQYLNNTPLLQTDSCLYSTSPIA